MSGGTQPSALLAFSRANRLLGDCVASALATSGLDVEQLEPRSSEAVFTAARDRSVIVIDSTVLDGAHVPELVDGVTGRDRNVVIIAEGDDDTARWAGTIAGEVVAVTDDLDALVTAVHRLCDAAIDDGRCSGDRADSDGETPQELLATLSARERNVLKDMMRGFSVTEIAAAHYVAVSTIRSQIRAILTKLNVRSQLAAVALAHEAGWQADGSRNHQI